MNRAKPLLLCVALAVCSTTFAAATDEQEIRDALVDASCTAGSIRINTQ